MQILHTVAAELKDYNGTINIPQLPADAVLAGALNIVYTLAGIICVIVIIIAGYIYVTSAGNASSVTKAKNAILYAIIGLIIVGLAFVITQFVAGSFQ